MQVEELLSSAAIIGLKNRDSIPRFRYRNGVAISEEVNVKKRGGGGE